MILFFSSGDDPDTSPNKKDRYNSKGDKRNNIFVPGFYIKSHSYRINQGKHNTESDFY